MLGLTGEENSMVMRRLAMMVWLGAAAFMGLQGHAAETLKIPVTADTWLSGSGKEADTNSGKAKIIKQKGYQEFALLDFDVAPLKGKKIVTATLHVAPAGGMKHGGAERGTDLRWFTISTIAGEWKEGEGSVYCIDGDGMGATFNEASFETTLWAYAGSKIYDVTMGNGNSIRCDVDAGDPKDGWLAIPVDKWLVEALVAKATHGLLLMDGNVFISSNAFIHSREG
jgi:hypothetical protein